MTPLNNGGDDAQIPPTTEAAEARLEQEKKFKETVTKVKEGKAVAAKARFLMSSDILAEAIERSMRRA